jgi:transposase
VREAEGRDTDPSGSVIDVRSVRAAPTVPKRSKGFDAGKKISGRKTLGVVDTLGLLLAVEVVAASTSDNAGGIAVFDKARTKIARLAKLWCDSGFKTTFINHCRHHHVATEVVTKIHRHTFQVLPRRWVVERSWAWTMNNRRLQVDDERCPEVVEGFIWAAHSRLLLRRLAPT